MASEAKVSADEKLEIGKRYLLPRQSTSHALQPDTVQIDDSVWRLLVRGYTREAGVRELDRDVAAICRKVVREVVRGKSQSVNVTPELVESYLGPRRFNVDHDLGESQIGVAIGLGTTEIGGELISVEVATMPGKGGLTITGSAGDVIVVARLALDDRPQADHGRVLVAAGQALGDQRNLK